MDFSDAWKNKMQKEINKNKRIAFKLRRWGKDKKAYKLLKHNHFNEV